MKTDTSYVPALGLPWLTRYYDVVLQSVLKEEHFKRRLIDQAAVRPGQRVLDLGCGTATLTLLLKKSVADADVVGLDGDPQTLAIARRKADELGLAVKFVEGLAYAPPFEVGSFDCIVSSLLFHHLSPDNKQLTLRKCLELLRPGGTLQIADWGRAQDPLMRLAFLSIQLLDGFATTADSVSGRLLDYIRQAGFVDVRETHRERTVCGTMSLYAARKPVN